jgi:hypothetical protein
VRKYTSSVDEHSDVLLPLLTLPSLWIYIMKWFFSWQMVVVVCYLPVCVCVWVFIERERERDNVCVSRCVCVCVCVREREREMTRWCLRLCVFASYV